MSTGSLESIINTSKETTYLIASESVFSTLNAVNMVQEGARKLVYKPGWHEGTDLGISSYNKPPNVFLHGFAQNRGVYVDAAGRFRERGSELNYRLGGINTFRGVDKNRQYLHNRIKAIIKQSKYTEKKVNLIGHSYGGLIARDYSYNYPENVENCVMLGTPNHGTWLALLGYGLTSLLKYNSINPILYHALGIEIDNVSAKLMIPGSKYLEELNSKIPPKDVNYISIYTPYDEAIIKKDSEILDFAININIKEHWDIKSRGHMALIHDYRVIDNLCDTLKYMDNLKKRNKKFYFEKYIDECVSKKAA